MARPALYAALMRPPALPDSALIACGETEELTQGANSMNDFLFLATGLAIFGLLAAYVRAAARL
jgi:hypothetical protein